ncbi:MAG: hypothetical protein V4691_02010 [Pseudomonadota bacterium]
MGEVSGIQQSTKSNTIPTADATPRFDVENYAKEARDKKEKQKAEAEQKRDAAQKKFDQAKKNVTPIKPTFMNGASRADISREIEKNFDTKTIDTDGDGIADKGDGLLDNGEKARLAKWGYAWTPEGAGLNNTGPVDIGVLSDAIVKNNTTRETIRLPTTIPIEIDVTSKESEEKLEGDELNGLYPQGDEAVMETQRRLKLT